MTMDELLTHLINKTKYDCEEAHRRIVFASTGLAGLHIIKQQYVEAVDEYRSTLRSVDEHSDEVRTDPLQLLHIVHNLEDILSLKPTGVGHTLNDSQLKPQADDIREKYLLKAAAFVTTTRDSWMKKRQRVVNMRQQLGDNSDWWAELLQSVTYAQLDSQLVSRVKEDLLDNVTPDKINTAHKFNTLQGLQYLLADQLQQLDAARDCVVDKLDKLHLTDPQMIVDELTHCCLRPPVNFTFPKCAFCLAEEHLHSYETKLFFCTDRGITETSQPEPSASAAANIQVSTKHQVTWAASDTEKALKTILGFAKTFAGEKELIDSGQLGLEIFTALKDEFKCLRPVWMAVRERVTAIDELNMAVCRMRLREVDEPLADPPPSNIVEPSQFDARRMKFSADKIVARNELAVKKGQLSYLKNLAKARDSLQSGDNPDPCPVCNQNLGTKWSVLQCGHCFCLTCIPVLIMRTCQNRLCTYLNCPVCRQPTAHADISYVSVRHADTDDGVADITVKGDHSTKVEGVVRCLLQIQATEHGSKCLVFSTWQEVLDILSDALNDNNINYRVLHSSRKFEDNLQSFKSDREVSVLLLPIHSGANGLNLIEATHVLLVEPVLNSAQELQAIGRVHRIGQTRPTTVHRFLVRGTIEERMHNLLQTVNMPLQCHDAEQSTLTIGDLNKLFEHMSDAPQTNSMSDILHTDSG